MRQKLGQHFLKNQEILREISSSFFATSGDTVIEIGPGHGELTKFLYERAKNENLSLILIERDIELFKKLSEKYSDKNIKIIHDDAIAYLQKYLGDAIERTGKLIIVGNIPYYITGHLLRVIGTAGRIPDTVHLVIQKEVAVRMSSTEPKMNLLAACVQAWGDVKILRTIKKNEFSPPPKVDSALISIQKKCDCIPQKYFEMAKTLFAHPRKMAINNISENFNKDLAYQLLKSINMPENARPQDFSVQNIIKMTYILYNDSV